MIYYNISNDTLQSQNLNHLKICQNVYKNNKLQFPYMFCTMAFNKSVPSFTAKHLLMTWTKEQGSCAMTNTMLNFLYTQHNNQICVLLTSILQSLTCFAPWHLIQVCLPSPRSHYLNPCKYLTLCI